MWRLRTTWDSGDKILMHLQAMAHLRWLQSRRQARAFLPFQCQRNMAMSTSSFQAFRFRTVRKSSNFCFWDRFLFCSQVNLKLMALLLPQPPENWDYKYAPLCLTEEYHFCRLLKNIQGPGRLKQRCYIRDHRTEQCDQRTAPSSILKAGERQWPYDIHTLVFWRLTNDANVVDYSCPRGSRVNGLRVDGHSLDLSRSRGPKGMMGKISLMMKRKRPQGSAVHHSWSKATELNQAGVSRSRLKRHFSFLPFLCACVQSGCTWTSACIWWEYVCVHACGGMRFMSRTLLDHSSTLYIYTNLELEDVDSFSLDSLFWDLETGIRAGPAQPVFMWVLGIRTWLLALVHNLYTESYPQSIPRGSPHILGQGLLHNHGWSEALIVDQAGFKIRDMLASASRVLR